MKVKKFGHSNKIYDQEKIKSSFCEIHGEG